MLTRTLYVRVFCRLRVKCKAVTPELVAAALGLPSHEHLVTACVICGTDITGPLLKLHEYHLSLFDAPMLERGRTLLERAARIIKNTPFFDSRSAVPAALFKVDAAAWRGAVDATEAFYHGSSSSGTAWASSDIALSPIAAALRAGALPSWSLAVAAHHRCWLPGPHFERPFLAQGCGGGIAGAHAPLRARMYARLGAVRPVCEHAWGGAWFGSEVTQSLLQPDARFASSSSHPPSGTEALCRHPWAGLAALLLPDDAGALLCLSRFDDDTGASFAALVLRYFLRLRTASSPHGPLRDTTSAVVEACALSLAARLRACSEGSAAE